MPQRRLLLLEANRLSAWHWQGGHLHAEQNFASDSTGHEAFAKYLAAHGNSIFSIMADVPEEGFQIEDIPFVSGKDRNALTQRRLAQYYYGTPFALATSLGRQKSGRRDEKMLFTALTQPRHLEPWLAALRAAERRLAGIYSASLALTALLHHLKLPGPRLVLWLTRSGIRQTFINDGKLYFSRLTTLAADTPEEVAVACAVEAGKIYQYLAGQRLIDRSATLQALILAHPDQFSILRAHCRPSAELAFEYIDLLSEARKAGLKTPPRDSHCELLLLHQLVLRPPGQQFAHPAELHFFRLWQLRSGLVAAAAIIFLICLLYAAKQYWDVNTLQENTLQMAEQTQVDENKYQAVMKSLPLLPISTENMRALVTRFEELDKRSPLMETMCIPLSRALDAMPGIELQRISWQLSAKLPPSTEQVSGVLKQPPLNVSGSYYAIAEINVHLPVALANDHRALLQLVNQFVTELGKEKSLGVQITQLPFDAESGKTIKSSDEPTLGHAEAPKFSFRLVQGF
ncbi:conserved protein of unknown function [Georgfuchsia toluolica]|uniref:Uncharacterized protein n=1 Tax=Georgfuchsia toluolica TaxID=424218 RepID=A0A916J3W8_9PROT|nr:hypothetical protein [Georgfuchsia toluolica]CAG4884239.1 conserved protein of unknown function [Georgfuchsia toluolica]